MQWARPCKDVLCMKLCHGFDWGMMLESFHRSIGVYLHYVSKRVPFIGSKKIQLLSLTYYTNPNLKYTYPRK